MTGESVLRFGEDGHPVTELAQVRELGSLQFAVWGSDERKYLMATDFKLGKVPGGVFVGGALDVSEGGLIGGNITVDIQGYLDCTRPSASTRSSFGRVCTYTSRTRVSGASPPAPRS